MNLATLPDDELLQVLRFLGNRELLRCRGVCRRLRDYALHPDLWRKRQLWLSDGVELCAAGLRLAPCLGTLDVHVWNHNNKEYLLVGTLLATTNCAVSKIQVSLSSELMCLLLAMVIARQATLGRLTSVSVMAEKMNTAEFQLVLDQLLHTQGLTRIIVRSSTFVQVPLGRALPKAAKSDAITASLRELEYRVNDDPRLLCYLQWHADTLQEVDLLRCTVPAGTATLLGSLPRLQELTCDMMDNMPGLLQCPNLKTLFLSVRADDSTQQFLPGVQQYLRHAVADRLENLTLEYEKEEYVESRDAQFFFRAVNLVHCLGGPSSSAPSALRSLRLAYVYRCRLTNAAKPQPQLEPLAAVLPRLENLVSLDLGGPPTDDFLAALDGRVLPRLERLRFYLNSHTGGCPHEWAHGPKPRALLRRYPRLHLDVEPVHVTVCEECEDTGNHHTCGCLCDFCAENTCHDFPDGRKQTLFSHPEHEVCHQKHSIFGGMRIDL